MWRYYPELLERPVPRYTSYPTAVEFNDRVGAADMVEALQTVELDTSISIYVHIPYCQSICWYCGCNTGAVNSGSDALKMALLAAGVGPGDEVIVPDLTYQAVALAVFYCGGKPVPVDVCRNDLQMDPDAVEKALSKKTKAIVAAHMFGRPCDVERIGKICRDSKIVFIEDVCQAESSRYEDRMLGSFGSKFRTTPRPSVQSR